MTKLSLIFVFFIGTSAAYASADPIVSEYLPDPLGRVSEINENDSTYILVENDLEKFYLGLLVRGLLRVSTDHEDFSFLLSRASHDDIWERVSQFRPLHGLEREWITSHAAFGYLQKYYRSNNAFRELSETEYRNLKRVELTGRFFVLALDLKNKTHREKLSEICRRLIVKAQAD